MNLTSTLEKVTTAPLPAATIYLGLLVLLLLITVSSISDLFDKRASVASVQAMLDQFKSAGQQPRKTDLRAPRPQARHFWKARP
ncbi:hypothetical protein [Nitrobacter winogradskyi]|uniref:Uncharacterized protein n=1 Tax=Nitrobacter winogradskyi TaxID=913 RepID=A0ACC6ALN2_NITWI|nr:hypothetical protein [Nitrobacter winogradskyi]MCP2000770.1 hypothetical protein [Nitrobacter winogradskyi]